MKENNGYIYRCDKYCPIRKKCFIIKSEKPIEQPITVLYKCEAQKQDIKINIGGARPP